MKKKIAELRVKTRVFFQTTATFISNMFRNKLDLTAEECEVSAYIWSVLGWCKTATRYGESGLKKTCCIGRLRASLCMSIALSQLRLNDKTLANTSYEIARIILKSQNWDDTQAISNAKKNKKRYEQALGRISDLDDERITEH
ncbi:hypothetical protein ACFLY0_02480 [Patescibacteria group bacterium]